MLAALLATALAAAPVVEPLFLDGGAISDAQFLPLPDGRRAVVAHPAIPNGGAVVFLPEDGTWRATDVPAGAVVAGPDGLHVVVAWPHPLLAGRHWRLDGARLVSLPDLPPPPQVHGLLAVSAEGDDVVAWASTAGVVERLEARGEAWRRGNVHAQTAFDDEGEVWLEEARAVRRGPHRHAAPPRPDSGLRTFDEGPGGDPVFLTEEPGRIRTWWRGSVFDHATPEQLLPDPEGCLDEPCVGRRVHHTLPRSGRLGFDAAGPVAAWVEVVTEGPLTCEVQPMHPCDPAGPINTCPKGPQVHCFGPKTPPVRTLYVQRMHGGRPVAEAVDLPIEPERVLDIAVEDGEISLLVVNAQARQGWGLHRVRLPTAEAGPPWPVTWPRAARAADFSLDTLVAAGFSVGMGQSPYAAPARFDGPTLRTGDTQGPGWVDRSLPDAAGATVSVTADVAPWHDGCGEPELAVAWGTRRWTLLLGAEPPRLRVDQDPPVRLEGPAHGAHEWTLSVGEDGVQVSIDGAVVHEGPLGTAPEGPTWASVGQRTSCGQPVGPAAVWRSVSVDGR